MTPRAAGRAAWSRVGAAVAMSVGVDLAARAAAARLVVDRTLPPLRWPAVAATAVVASALTIGVTAATREAHPAVGPALVTGSLGLTFVPVLLWHRDVDVRDLAVIVALRALPIAATLAVRPAGVGPDRHGEARR